MSHPFPLSSIPPPPFLPSATHPLLLPSSSFSPPLPPSPSLRPLLEKETTGSKIWCASGVDLRGGRTKDGAKMVGSSVFYDSNAPAASDAALSAKAANDLETLDSELKDGEKASKSAAESGFSSYVWICTSTHKESRYRLRCSKIGCRLQFYHLHFILRIVLLAKFARCIGGSGKPDVQQQHFAYN